MKNDLPLFHGAADGAVALARRIAAGDLTAAEAVDAHIARIEAVQPKLNALCARRFDEARAQAREADARRARGEPAGPLHGVPVTIKDSLDVQGLPSTFGLPSRRSHRADADEVHVARLRAAGAIVLGKTNVAQALLFYETDNPLHGRTANPWDLSRTPGGSSGGEAALVAAGASPLGLGTDIGGSVRIPSAFCGVVGFKPTSGRCDDLGRWSVPLGQRAIPSQVGPIARTVEDAAVALEILNGGARPAMPAQPLGDWRGVDLRGLRVACVADDGTFEPSPAIVRAVREAAQALRAGGAQVHEWQPPAAHEGLALFYGILGGDGMRLLRSRMGRDARATQLAQLMALAGLPRSVVVALQRMLAAAGQRSLAAGLTAFGFRDTAHYWTLLEAQHDYRERVLRALDAGAGGPFDVILCPACPLPALPHGATKDLATVGASACLYNLLGFPAGVVPVTRVREDECAARPETRDIVLRRAREADRGSAGLPVGVQLVARPWMEHVALAAMAQVERCAAPAGMAPAH